MRAGIVVAAQPGVEDLAVQAEGLGLHSFWVNDTPMLHGDPFVTLALCAKATRRIKLGIGVTSPALRSAPAAASGLASLNALAPGRIICGVGTGNTGAHVNTTDPIEFVVAALLGPKAAAVAGRRGTGLISYGLLDPAGWQALHDARRGAAGALDTRPDSYLTAPLYVLDADEDPHGDAVRDATGHAVLSLLAFAADTAADANAFVERLGSEEREAVQRLLGRRGTTAAAPDRHTKLYSNYLGRIPPQDRDLILPSLMNALALVGTRDDLLTRIATLEQAGVDELLIQPVVDPSTEMAQLAKLLM
ncbi:LLM class flavin-dependent oxidoreductase [Actinomadura macra]|uniref:LLM class flavin-dependent oxidoreductase n=1 Tax=Actinomadura macra TaxID=46164 RepID=UPI0008320287|nr:LLM class flavin-dependent oxidoreductase [Actinomadura macra]